MYLRSTRANLIPTAYLWLSTVPYELAKSCPKDHAWCAKKGLGAVTAWRQSSKIRRPARHTVECKAQRVWLGLLFTTPGAISCTIWTCPNGIKCSPISTPRGTSHLLLQRGLFLHFRANTDMPNSCWARPAPCGV